jgi:hypothetical protein
MVPFRSHCDGCEQARLAVLFKNERRGMHREHFRRELEREWEWIEAEEKKVGDGSRRVSTSGRSEISSMRILWWTEHSSRMRRRK